MYSGIAEFAGIDAVLREERLEEEDGADAADCDDADEEDRVADGGLPSDEVRALAEDADIGEMCRRRFTAGRLAKGEGGERAADGDDAAEHYGKREAGGFGERRADESAGDGGDHVNRPGATVDALVLVLAAHRFEQVVDKGGLGAVVEREGYAPDEVGEEQQRERRGEAEERDRERESSTEATSAGFRPQRSARAAAGMWTKTMLSQKGMSMSVNYAWLRPRSSFR